MDIHDEWVADERRYFSEGAMARLFTERDDDNPITARLAPGR